MALKDIIIASLSKDEGCMDFSRRVKKYLMEVYNLDLPRVSESIYPGKFSAGEYNPQSLTDLRGKNVYLFAVPTDPKDSLHSVSPGEMKSRAEFSASVAHEYGAKKVILVAPDLYFGRADKGPTEIHDDMPLDKIKNFKGKGNIAKAQARAFKANFIDHIITMDLHSHEIVDSYKEVYGRDDALIKISSLPLLVSHLMNYSALPFTKEHGARIVIAGPDEGSRDYLCSIVSAFKDLGIVNLSYIYFDKTRAKANDPNYVELGNPTLSENFTTLNGKHLLVIDDMDDTCGTKKAFFNTIRTKGVKCNGNDNDKPLSISSYSTHAVLNGIRYEDAMINLASAEPFEVIYTDTHPVIEKNLNYDLRQRTSVIRTSSYFAEVIRSFELGLDPRSLFLTEGKFNPSIVAKFAKEPFRSKDDYNINGHLSTILR